MCLSQFFNYFVIIILVCFWLLGKDLQSDPAFGSGLPLEQFFCQATAMSPQILLGLLGLFMFTKPLKSHYHPRKVMVLELFWIYSYSLLLVFILLCILSTSIIDLQLIITFWKHDVDQ